MAFIRCGLFSEVLRIQTEINVVIPEQSGIAESYPVIWLFHGMSDNHSGWIRNTSVERYAEEYGFAVVMADAQRSYYCDMHEGGAYWRYMSDELITKARKLFPLSHERSKNAAAGLSMGGFGAYRLAFERPELICAAGSFSGVLDIPSRLKMNRGNRSEMRRIFGPPEQVPGSVNDLIHRMSRLTDPESLPALYQCCGTRDVYLKNNRRFASAAQAAGIPVTYHEDEGYGHEWNYWDISVRKFFAWAAAVMKEK